MCAFVTVGLVEVLHHHVLPGQIHINRTDSMAHGLYSTHLISASAPLSPGDRVAVYAPPRAVALGCVRSTRTLLFKEIAGVPGDRVCLHEDGTLWREGHLYSRTASTRADGTLLRELFAFTGCLTLGEKEYLLATPAPRSCDSRYLGTFSRAQIVREVRPIWTWTPPPQRPSPAPFTDASSPR